MSDTFTPEANLPRIMIIGAAFLTVTLALILLQPDGESAARNTSEDEPSTVTRADTGILSLTDEDVSMLRDTATTTSADANVSQASEVLKPAAQDPVMDDITAGVLASLGSKKPSTAPVQSVTEPSEDDALRSLTSSVLSGLSNSSSKSMEQLVVQALNQGQSDSYIEAMINAAADAGSIEVPSALRTGEGRVDTDTLLAELVRKSDPDAEATPTVASNEGVEVRVIQRAGETRRYNFYTVQKGDSLGAIAHRFYGDAAFYNVIFEANQRSLTRADRIRAGQRLTIPDLNSSG